MSTDMIPCGCGATLRRELDWQTGDQVYTHGDHPLQLRLALLPERDTERFREWLDTIHREQHDRDDQPNT